MFQNFSIRHKRNAAKVGQKRKRGFSLPEIIIASSVSLMLTTGLLSYFTVNYKIGFVNTERNRINADMRGLTGKLIRDGRQSNYFVLYDSIVSDARDEAGDRQLDGEAGDFLVFVSTEATGDSLKPTKINRVVGYFRAVPEAGSDGLAPVLRFEKVIDPPSLASVESLLPDVDTLGSAREVIEMSRGLADERLFFNFWGRSIMVNGQIFHGNDAKRVTETYNFTVSPRG